MKDEHTRRKINICSSVQGFENFCFIAVGAFHYLALEEDGRLLAQPLIMSQSKASTISIRFHDVIKKRKCTTSAIHVRIHIEHVHELSLSK
ncbi:unnamed protein product, partial [Brassica rapa]